jgi:5-methylcytosine-specific restriction protein A
VTAHDLRRIRKQLGLTQAALAERVGVTPNSLARQERGELGIAEPVARLLWQLEAQALESAPLGGRKMAPKARDFEAALNALFADAWRRRLEHLEVEAGALHRQVGGYPDPTNNRMPVCCNVMRAAMRAGDRILEQPPKGAGARLRIRYVAEARPLQRERDC